MKISQLKSLIKESIKEVLNENEINTIDYKKLKAIYTLASKLKLYESYIVDETIEDMRRLENAVKTNDESVFEELEESNIDTYELQGLAKLNPEQQAKWKGIDIALRELSRIIYKMDLNLIGEKFKKLAVAINNFNAPTMQERSKSTLKEEITLNSPSFKKLVSKIQQISDESGNDWEALKTYLRRYARFSTYTTGTNPAAHVVNFFAITKGKDKYVKKNPSAYVQVGDWYIRPW